MTEAIVQTRVGAMSYLAPAHALAGDEANAQLQAAFTSCIAANNVRVVLDLATVPLVNGRAIEVMLDAHARLGTLGGGLKVLNPNGLVRDIFRATGFDQSVQVGGPAAAAPGLAGPARSATSAPAARGASRQRLGDILIGRGLLKPEQLEQAIKLQSQLSLQLGRILVDKGFVRECDLLEALSAQFALPCLSLRPGMYDPAAAALLGKDVARRLEVLPLFCVHKALTIATSDPQAIPVFDEVATRTGCRIRLVLARREEIVAHLGEAYDASEGAGMFISTQEKDLELVDAHIPDDYTRIDELAGTSPVINLVNAVIQRAVRDRASDIHIEVSRSRARVRFRIDGVLYEVMTPPLELYPAIVSRLKVMANLDIAERRLPQDGRIQVTTQNRSVDLRFSSLPGLFGEKIVLRVLDKNQSILDVEKLALSEANLACFKRLLSRSHGLILVTGPTGSGKTTTLYAAINQLKSIEKNIVTIEDPVEIQLDIINQNQVNEAIGLSFPKVLKHVLRQDPDIIMVGEIRDRQTAQIAVQAALTGHLVLSTLHTNDALGAVSRMLDMGIEPYLLASAVIGVMAQRLVRRICAECTTHYLAPPEVAAACGWAPGGSYRLARGRGCPACYDSGYRGRVAIHELIEIDGALQQRIVAKAGAEELRAAAQAAGQRGLRGDGMDTVLAGHTTPEEIARAIHMP